VIFTLSSESFFFFISHATPDLYTLSLHDALPIYAKSFSFIIPPRELLIRQAVDFIFDKLSFVIKFLVELLKGTWTLTKSDFCSRSEEHTSELQSRFDLVCRLLLEKKKNIFLLSHG